MRQIALALALLLGLPALATGQAPPPVPALPDAQRLTSYNLTASTCACSVGFQIYGDGTDVDQWIDVFVNGVSYPSTDSAHGWSLSSATGSLGNIPRPITNAVLTFAQPQTGTVLIVGARRPRRVSQFPESRGVTAREINQAITDIVAQNRETWDKLNSAVVGQPGEVLRPLPGASSRAGNTLCFDTSGNPILCTGGPPVTPPVTVSSVVNMLNYGADPTGVADSCATPLTNALAALSTLPQGGILYWPSGTYTCAKQIQWSNKPITIRGDGSAHSTITFTSAAANNAGISITQSSGAVWSNVDGLTLLTSVPQPTNNAITFKQTDVTKLGTTARFTDLTIAGVGLNFGTNYWHNGIYCTGCIFGYMANLNIFGGDIRGPTGVSSSNMLAGINLNGQGLMPGEASTDVLMEGIRIGLSQIGVYMSGDSEGAHINGISTFQVNHGFYLDDYAGSSDPTSGANVPGPFIVGQDCVAWMDCILIKGGWTFTAATGSQWQKNPVTPPGSATPQFTAVRLLDGQYKDPANPTGPLQTVGTLIATIHDNQCEGGGDFLMQPDQTYMCFELGNGANANFISNNIGGFIHEFINFHAGTNPNNVSNNSQLFTNNGISKHWAIGTSNQFTIFKDNRPINTPLDSGIVTMASGTATPTVGFTQGVLFLLNNPSAQNITNILGGYIGQQITLLSQTTFTTIVPTPTVGAAGILLTKPVGSNYVMAPGNTLTLQRTQETSWVETARTP